jgi:uncharacterized membrane protein YcaP (DUF421 family)
MNTVLQIDWNSIFIPTLHIGEIILRGTIVYLALFFLLRILRREAGALGISDLLVVVLIADAAQNAMGSDYKSITEGLILVLTIVFWDYFLDWLSYKFPKVRRILHPSPILLIKDGRILRQNLKREMITIEEVKEQLREHGVEDITAVKKCYLEEDGHVSVITKSGKEDQQVSKKLPT